MAEDEAKLLAEAAKLPIAERAAHSQWKVRSAAYDDIKAGCERVIDDSDPVLVEYASIYPKASADSNAAALDKALDALASLLAVCSEQTISRFAAATCNNIAGKCLGARPGTVRKATECLQAFVEAEQAEKVTSALVDAYGNKVPKAVVGSLDATLICIRAFGAKVMPAQVILKAMPPLLESKDANARGKVKEIVAELARWIGPELVKAALFEKMPDAFRKDVEKLLEEAPTGRPKPERFTRKEQAKQAAAVEQEEEAEPGAAAGAAVEEEEEVVDSYEFAEPKDIVPELKKDFWEGLAAAKWSERKAALTQLKDLAAYPRLANGDFFEVNKELKKIITKDSNIQVVAEAINCTANLAKGLRKDYGNAARSFCPALLEKLKDKSAVVTKAALEALGQMHQYCFTLTDVADDVVAGLTHQNPKVKESCLNWMTECLTREAKASVAKLMPAVIPAAAKCLEEGAPAIREAAQNALVQAALKLGSIVALDKALAKIDEQKKKKLEEAFLSVARAAKPGRPPPPPAPIAVRNPSSKALAAGSASGTPAGSPRGGGSRPNTAKGGARTSGTNARPGTAAAAGGRPRAAGTSTGGSSSGAGGGGSGGSAAADGGGEDEGSIAGALIGKVEAEQRFEEVLGAEVLAGLKDALWKVRLETMEQVVAKAQEPEAEALAPLLAQGMAHFPGWEEKNFQVMSKQYEVIRICSACSTFTKREAFVAITGAVDKLADIKLKGPAFEMLLAASEAVGPQFVSSLLHKKAAVHKNPKVLTEALNWVSQAIQEFGLPFFSVPALLEWAKADLGSSTPAVRTAAVALLGTMHSFVGPALAEMVRPDVKPALWTTVEARFQDCPQQSGFEPKRQSRVAKAKPAGKGVAKGKGGGSTEEPVSMDDLLPRADISGQITSAFLANLTSSNWKERKAALDELEQILAGAGNRIQPSVGDLMPALKQRMTDSNKNLVIQALQLLGKLAKAMGRPIAREARGVLGPAIKCLTDPKPMVRQAVVDMLDAWMSVAAVDAVLDELLEVLASPKCVSEGMQAGISWMATAATAGKLNNSDTLAAAVKAGAMGAAYKTVPVREAAAQLFSSMIASSGVGEVAAAVQGLPKGLATAATEAITKANGGIAAGASGSGAVAGAGNARGLQSARTSNSSGSGRTSHTGASMNGSSGKGPAGPAAVLKAVGGTSVRGSKAAGASSALLTGASSASGALLNGQDDGPLLFIDSKKEDRAKKARYKGIKFELRPDEVQQLEVDLGSLTSPVMKAGMFSKDFKKQCAAADSLRDAFQQEGIEGHHYCAACSCLDLLLKWSVVRLAEGNTQTLISVLGMVKVLFDMMVSANVRLTDYEAKTFLPGLVEKCGLAQDRLKADCRELMRKTCMMYSATKMITFLQEGLHSKNNRSRVQCAEEVGCIIEREGPKVYAGAKCDVLQVLARLVSERDKDIRQAALGGLEVVYGYEAQGIWKHLGRLSEQQKGIIEERLKTVDKELARKGLAPGFRAAALAAACGAADGTSADGGAHAGPEESGSSSTVGLGLRGGMGPAAVAGTETSMAASALRHLHAEIGEAAAATGNTAIHLQYQRKLTDDGTFVPTLRPLEQTLAGNGTSAGPHTAPAAAAYIAPPASSRAVGPGGAATTGRLPQLDGQLDPRELAAKLSSVQGTPPYQQQQPVAFPHVHAPHLQLLVTFTEPGELAEEFERCLVLLANGQMVEVIEIMKLLCYEMMDLGKAQAALAAPGGNSRTMAIKDRLTQHADRLVGIMAARTKQIFSEASAFMRVNPGQLPNGRACKYCLNTLMNIFTSSYMPRQVQGETLHRLMEALLLRLVDEQLPKLAEGEALLKALNVLMLKILENCNRNHSFSALLSLLIKAPEEVTGIAEQELRWADLVVKCLIKITKALPATLENIDLKALLSSIHNFFEDLGVDEIRRRATRDDKPLRMVKTILHELCKLKGSDIYRYTDHIPISHSTSGQADSRPVIFPYIDLNLSTLQGTSQRPMTAGASIAHNTPGVHLPQRPATAAATPGARGTGTPGAALRAGGEAFNPGMTKRVELVNLLKQAVSAMEQKASGDVLGKAASELWAGMQRHRASIAEVTALLGDVSEQFRNTVAAHLRHLEAGGTTASFLQQQQQLGGSSTAGAPDAVRDVAGPADKSGGVQLQRKSSSGGSDKALFDIRGRLEQLRSNKTGAVLAQQAAPPVARGTIMAEVGLAASGGGCLAGNGVVAGISAPVHVASVQVAPAQQAAPIAGFGAAGGPGSIAAVAGGAGGIGRQAGTAVVAAAGGVPGPAVSGGLEALRARMKAVQPQSVPAP